MAGDWIKFEIGTSDKPEIWAIAQALNIDPDAVVGKLLRVWGWFDQHTEIGNAPTVTKMLLDRIVGVTGFCDCVISAGWMTESDGEIFLTNFDRHNGKTAKTRAVTAKRVAQFKSNGGKSNDDANAEVTPAPLPKEEKRREDNKNIKKINQKKSDLDYSVWPSMPAEQILSDWHEMRKRIKANVSQTVINGFGKELHAAARFGYTVDQCLTECITRNWRGFKFEWLQNSMGAGNAANQQRLGASSNRGLPADDTSWANGVFDQPEFSVPVCERDIQAIEGDFSSLGSGDSHPGGGCGSAAPVDAGNGRVSNHHLGSS